MPITKLALVTDRFYGVLFVGSFQPKDRSRGGRWNNKKSILFCAISISLFPSFHAVEQEARRH